MNDVIIAEIPAQAPPLITPAEMLHKCRTAYAASADNDDQKLFDWYAVIDEHAESLFQLVESLQNGLEKAAAVILASDQEKRHLNEKLLNEIKRHEAVKEHHAAKVKELNAEIEELKVENIAWSEMEGRMIKSAKEAVEKIRNDNQSAALKVVHELKKRGMPDIAHLLTEAI